MKHLIKTVLFALAGLAGLPAVRAGTNAPAAFSPGARILFQGDSITDGNRGRNQDPNHILGHGYVFLIAAEFGAHFPERQLTFLNRGISGHKVTDLAGRWKGDTLDLKPDVLSILIGVNDVGTALRGGQPLDAGAFEKVYDQLLAEVLATNAQAKIVLCEPFIEPGSVNAGKWEEWQAATKSLQAAVERLGAKYHAPVVHFQKMFDEAKQRAPMEYWIWDGVHPTYSGHQLMAEEWVRVVRAAWPDVP